MLRQHIITTVNQRVLSFLVKFSDEEFYERQIARSLNIAYGSANRSLNQLYTAGAVRRRQEGKMYFYSVDAGAPAIIEYKKLINLLLTEDLVEQLKETASRVILYGSCAKGTDTSKSDFDLFVIASDTQKAADIISGYSLPQEFGNLRIQPVIRTPVELLQAGETEQTFIEEVEKGIIMWEKAANESGF